MNDFSYLMIIVSLIGLKKCGKTTTSEALISEFKSRGMKVGGVKWMVQASFTIDTEGKDTWRHQQAGADFTVEGWVYFDANACQKGREPLARWMSGRADRRTNGIRCEQCDEMAKLQIANHNGNTDIHRCPNSHETRVGSGA